jgi:nitrogen fixation NifU-like protein
MPGDVGQLYSPVIRAHSEQPRNRGRLAGANRRASGRNPLCGDCVTVWLRVEGERVSEAAFESFGCALMRASASLLTEALKGRRVEAVPGFVAAVERLVREAGRGEGELSALAGVASFPARIPCVLLPWRTALEALQSPVQPE